MAKVLGLGEFERARDASVSQDLDGHLRGGVSSAEVDSFAREWASLPEMKDRLFAPLRPGWDGALVPKTFVAARFFPERVADFAALGRSFAAIFDTALRSFATSLAELAARYRRTLPELESATARSRAEVHSVLKELGFDF